MTESPKAGETYNLIYPVGTHSISFEHDYVVDVLIVGGGGGGKLKGNAGAGGNIIYAKDVPIQKNSTYTIQVGAGGASDGGNGASSSAFGAIAEGGGGGTIEKSGATQLNSQTGILNPYIVHNLPLTPTTGSSTVTSSYEETLINIDVLDSITTTYSSNISITTTTSNYNTYFYEGYGTTLSAGSFFSDRTMRDYWTFDDPFTTTGDATWTTNVPADVGSKILYMGNSASIFTRDTTDQKFGAGCLKLGGVNNYLRSTDNPNTHYWNYENDFSISIWTKFPSGSNPDSSIVSVTYLSSNGFRLTISPSYDDTGALNGLSTITLYLGAGRLVGGTWVPSGWSGYFVGGEWVGTYVLTETFSHTSWNNITFTLENDNGLLLPRRQRLKGYINGVCTYDSGETKKDLGYDLSTSTNGFLLEIGRDGLNYVKKWFPEDTLIDDFRFYERILTPEEINDLVYPYELTTLNTDSATTTTEATTQILNVQDDVVLTQDTEIRTIKKPIYDESGVFQYNEITTSNILQNPYSLTIVTDTTDTIETALPDPLYPNYTTTTSTYITSNMFLTPTYTSNYVSVPFVETTTTVNQYQGGVNVYSTFSANEQDRGDGLLIDIIPNASFSGGGAAFTETINSNYFTNANVITNTLGAPEFRSLSISGESIVTPENYLKYGYGGNATPTAGNEGGDGIVIVKYSIPEEYDIITYEDYDYITQETILGYNYQTETNVSNIVQPMFDYITPMIENLENAVVSFSNIAGVLEESQLPAFTGDASSDVGSSTLTLATVNPNVGQYGSSLKVPKITIDGKGRITSCTEENIPNNSVSSQWTTVSNGIIYDDGNVGIGGITPQHKLHVDGNIKSEYNITANGFMYANTFVGNLSGNTINSSGTIKCDAIDFRKEVGYNNYGSINYGAGFYHHIGSYAQTRFFIDSTVKTGYYTNLTDVDRCCLENTCGNSFIRMYHKGYIEIGGVGTDAQVQTKIGSHNRFFGDTINTGDRWNRYINVEYGNGGSDSTRGTGANDICAQFSSTVWISDFANIIWTSDERVKKDFTEVDDDYALNLINAIEPKLYKYRDIVSKGDDEVLGFISQQVESVIPKATTKQIGSIPNIYKLCNCSNNSVELPYDVDVSAIQGDNLTSNVKLIYEDGTEQVAKFVVEERIDGRFMILENTSNAESTSNVFVYGTEINDLTTIDKNYIYTLNVAATQSLSKKIDQLRQNTVTDNLTVNGVTTLNSNLIMKGHILPHDDIQYDLGSSSNKWRDLYLSGDTITLGNSKISSDPDTKGIVIKDDTNQITSITAAAISIADPVTGNVVKIEKTEQGIKFNEYSSANEPVVSSVSDFITTEVCSIIINSCNYITSNSLPDLTPYALAADLPDLTPYALAVDIPTLPDLTPYALTTDIPTLPDLSPYALKTELKWTDNTSYISYGDIRVYNDKFAIVQSVLIDSSVRRYPPVPVNDGLTNINSGDYGNGVYITSSSSGEGLHDLFNMNTFDYGWVSDASYDNYGGYYYGFNNIGGYYGEWIKIQLPITLYLNYIKLSRNTDDFKVEGKTPRNYILLGSTNGNNWTPIGSDYCDLRFNQSYTSPNTPLSTGFNFFAIVFRAVDGWAPTENDQIVCMLNEIELYGREKLPSTIENIELKNNGNVEIGKANAPVQLHVEGALDVNGIVGIGLSNPSSTLHISETQGTVASPNNGTILLDHENNGGKSSIVFRSKVNRGSDYGFIQYQDNSTGASSGENAILTIGTQNDGDDHIAVMPSGNCGIGKTNPGYKLDVEGNCRVSSTLNVGGNKLVIEGTSPTLYLRDADSRSGMIHMNGNLMYFLNGSGNNSETWAQQANNRWAMTINMANNNIETGGTLYTYGIRGYSSLLLGSWTYSNNITVNNNGYNYQRNNSYYWSVNSDERIKENIEEANYEMCYNNVSNLPLKRYNLREGVNNTTHKDKNKLGFIAQQVQAIFPKNVEICPVSIYNSSNVIIEEIEDCLSVDVEQVQMSLYGAFKYAQTKIKNLEAENKILNDKINILSNHLFGSNI